MNSLSAPTISATKNEKLLIRRRWQARLVDGNFEAGQLVERPRADSNRADDVSFACSYARLLSFHFGMAPHVLQNCSWLKLTFTGEKKYLSDREIQLGDGSEGKRRGRISKVVPECCPDEPAVVVRGKLGFIEVIDTLSSGSHHFV